MSKLLDSLAIAAIATVVIGSLMFGFAEKAKAQVVPAQNQITIGPYGGLVTATSTNGNRKLEQLIGTAFGQIAYWDGLKWDKTATSTLGLGTVTSVNASGGTTGLSFSGGPITTSGTLTLAGLLNVANGGTGSSTLSGILRGDGTNSVKTLLVGTGLSFDGTTLSATGGSGGGISTTTPWTPGNIVSVVDNSTVTSIGSSTLTLGTGLSYTGTLGRFLEGVSGTLNLSGVLPSSIALPKGNFLVGNDAGTAQATSTIFIDSLGKVGIGTTTPSTKLQIAGDIGNITTRGQLHISGATDPLKTLDIGIDTTGNRGYISAGRIGIAPYPLLFNPFGGNIAIGTSSPTSLLNISASDSGTTLNAASAAMLDITNRNTTDNNFGDLTFSTADANGATVVTSKIAGVNTAHTAGATSGDLAFLTRSAGTIAEKMRIQADGDVGIGITNPAQKLAVTGDSTISGYLRVGSNSAPTNTTAGDLTSTRLSVGNGAFSAAAQFARVTGTMTDTSGTAAGANIQGTLSPAGNSSALFRTLNMSATYDAAGINFTASVMGSSGGYFESRIINAGAITATQGLSSTGLILGSNAVSLTSATDVTGIVTQGLNSFSNALTPTITRAVGLRVQDSGAGTATITGQAGVMISPLTAATNNTALLIGGTTVPAGNYGIYSATSNNSYFAGNVGIGTTTPYAQLSLGGGNLVIGAATAGGTPGDIFLPKLGTAAGAFLAVDATGKIIATTTPSGGGGSKWATSTLATAIYPNGASSVGIGTTSPWGTFSVASTSYNYIQPLIAFATSTAPTGNLFGIFGTSTVQIPTTMPGSFFSQILSGAKVYVGMWLQRFGMQFDDLSVDGTISTGEWTNIPCDGFPPATAISLDANAACGSWNFDEVGTGTWGIGAGNSPAFGRLATASGAGQIASLSLGGNDGNNVVSYGTSTPRMEFVIRKQPGSAGNVSFLVGFNSGYTTSTLGANGCAIVATTTTQNWTFACANGSGVVSQQISSGISSTTSNYTAFRIEADSVSAKAWVRTPTTAWTYIGAITSGYVPNGWVQPVMISASNTGAAGLDVQSMNLWVRRTLWPN